MTVHDPDQQATHTTPAAEPPTHELTYRAGIAGFGTMDDVPHWACTCGQWRINRNLRTGNPQRETAAKKHRAHVREVTR